MQGRGDAREFPQHIFPELGPDHRKPLPSAGRDGAVSKMAQRHLRFPASDTNPPGQAD